MLSVIWLKSFLSVDMLLRNSIFARLASNRYISRYARNSICCLRQRWSLCDLPRFPNHVLPLGKTYRIPAGDISSRRRRHIERRVSGAYRRRVIVSSTRLTRHVLFVGTYRQVLHRRWSIPLRGTMRSRARACSDRRRRKLFLVRRAMRGTRRAPL